MRLGCLGPGLRRNEGLGLGLFREGIQVPLNGFVQGIRILELLGLRVGPLATGS